MCGPINVQLLPPCKLNKRPLRTSDKAIRNGTSRREPLFQLPQFSSVSSPFPLLLISPSPHLSLFLTSHPSPPTPLAPIPSYSPPHPIPLNTPLTLPPNTRFSIIPVTSSNKNNNWLKLVGWLQVSGCYWPFKLW